MSDENSERLANLNLAKQTIRELCADAAIAPQVRLEAARYLIATSERSYGNRRCPSSPNVGRRGKVQAG